MNKKIEKILLTLIILLTVSNKLFAQISEDPNHNFYKDCQRWQIQGIVQSVPAIRPYPVNIIKDILLQVAEYGSDKEKIKADEYWQEITGKPIYLYFEALANSKIKDSGISLYGAVEGDTQLVPDFVSLGYKIGFNGYADLKNDGMEAKEYFSTYYPAYSYLPYDTVQDPGKLGPLEGYFNANENLSIGNKNYYFQMGINRLGYGDFIGNNIGINEASYHSANMAITILKDKWNYSQLYSSIGATKAFDGSGLKNNKYLVFHQFEYNLNKKIKLAYYESIVFGNRFDFSYMIPAPYMAIQGLGGCDDNLQMGIRFNYNPVKNLLWANDILVDDVNFNDLAKLDFDTKLRVAANTGLIYSFDNIFIDDVKLNYTLITPYTYSHWDFTNSDTDLIDKNTYSYQNYTNNGISLGTNVPPNSDSIRLSANLTPISKLKLNIDFGFVRHGNVNESISDEEAMFYLLCGNGAFATDGSIFNNTFYPKYNKKNGRERESQYLSSAWNSLNFLNQNHKMYIFQGGLSASYQLRKTKFGTFSIKAGYTGEYIKNKGVDSNIFDKEVSGNIIKTENDDGTITVSLEGPYTYKNIEYSSYEELIEQVKADWVASFYNQFNNYIYLGFEWNF